MEAASENNYETKILFYSKMILSFWHNDTIRPAFSTDAWCFGYAIVLEVIYFYAGITCQCEIKSFC